MKKIIYQMKNISDNFKQNKMCKIIYIFIYLYTYAMYLYVL